jgi:peroxiredoxin
MALLPGDKAPDFTLETLDGRRKVNLASYQGNRPVVLIFGSYT